MKRSDANPSYMVEATKVKKLSCPRIHVRQNQILRTVYTSHFTIRMKIETKGKIFAAWLGKAHERKDDR